MMSDRPSDPVLAPKRLRAWRANPRTVASFLALPDEWSEAFSSSSTSARSAAQRGDVPAALLSSAGLALIAPALPVSGSPAEMPLHTSGYVPLDVMEESPGEEDPVPEAIDPRLAWDRGPGHMQRHEHEEPPEPPAHHDSDDMMMADIGLAMISSGMTVLLAMMGAVCALRICREMIMRRRGANSAAGSVVEAAASEGSVQAFRPFAGQGYRLVLEGDVNKPPTPHASPNHASATEDKGRADTRFPSEAGLPNFGAGLTSLDA